MNPDLNEFLLDLAGAGVGYYDCDGTCRLMNRQARIYLGDVNKTDFVGKHVTEIFPEEILKYTIPRLKIAQESEIPAVYEDKVELPVGTHWFQSTYTRICASDATVLGVMIVSKEVTQLKISQVELQESRRRLKVLMDNLPGLAYRCKNDDNWTMEIVSKGCLELTGYSPDDLLDNRTLSYADLMHSDDLERVSQEVADSLARSNSFEFEYRIICADGTVKTVWERGVGIRNDGVVTHLEGFITDISHLKNTRRALLEIEEQMQAFFNHSPTGMAIVDENLTYLAINETLAEINGLSIEQHLGKTVKDIFPKLTEEVGDSYRSIFRTGKPLLDIHMSTENHRNEMIHWTANMFPIPGEDGKPKAIGGVVIDETARVNAEKEKQRLEKQVHQTQRLESIGRLAGGVAHDLNNLLSPILGYGEMLLDETGAGDPRTELLDEIVNAGKRARDLVHQLLAFSRKQTLEFTSININDLLYHFEKLIRRTIREDIELKFNKSPQIMPMAGDIGQIEQIIMNLALNAQDAMPQKGMLLFETYMSELDVDYTLNYSDVAPGDYVTLAITDSGTGMDADTVKQIFEPFFTTKKPHEGTGLGLATVYGIIKQHGGHISVYSEVSKGTTFKVFFPVQLQITENILDQSQSSPSTRGSETILLVEDDDPVRNLALAVLKKQGYQVINAASGEIALDLIQENRKPVDLLITDVVMPGMNGKELYESVQQVWPDTRVLYMSGYPNEVISKRGILDTHIDFLQKPFSIRMLKKRVRDVLDR